MLIFIVSQINLLLSLVNDMLDLKLIDEGKFVPKKELFKPRELLQFISAMFEPQMKLADNTLSITVAV